MAIGVNTYKGLGVPRYGESEMRQESSLDMLTMTHSSLDGGDFIVFRSLLPEGSTANSEVLSITSAGNIVPVSTVLGNATIAGFRRPVVESTVGRVLTIAESGTLFVVSSAVGTSMTFDLPVGSGVPGTWYEFWISSAVAAQGDVRIAASSAVAAKIHGYGEGTSAVSTFAAITPITTAAIGSYQARLTAVTSLLWALETNGGYSSISTLAQGVWIVASTAA